MTTVQFFKSNGQWIGYHASGHSGYGVEGEDIVCASISTALQMVATGLKDVKKLRPKVKISNDQAEMDCQLVASVEQAQDMLEMLYITILDLAKQYPKYLKLEVIEKC